MKVLVAGALADLGIKTCELLLQRDHDVFGLTRSSGRGRELQARGVRCVVGDLLERDSTTGAVTEVQPDAIVSVPIALPERGPLRPRDLHATNRLRVEGTRNLLDAAQAAGVRRVVSESIVAIYGYGDVSEKVLDEDSPTARSAPVPAVQPALDALHLQEEMLLDAARAGSVEAVIVRLGFYYGAEVGSTRFMTKLLRRKVMPVARSSGALPWVEITDAAAGVVAALERGRSGEIYNIVGDESLGLGDLARTVAQNIGAPPPRVLPTWLIRLGGSYAALVGETHLYVSNEKAKRELGWSPRFPTVAQGVAHAAEGLRASSDRRPNG